MTLWPLFGATNQCLAALALLAITIYLKQRGGLRYLVSGLPAAFMIVMTTWALILNEINFINVGNVMLSIINGCIVLIALWIVVEGLNAFFGAKTLEARAQA